MPCGEQSQSANEVCTLGSININCPDFWDADGTFKTDTFSESVRLSVRFLDDVVDMMDINDRDLKEMSLHTRRIGLGLMGWADVLHSHNFSYGSVDGMELLTNIGKTFKTAAHKASLELGHERGSCPALKEVGLQRRNVTVTCIAPTGGISLVVGNKGFSVEPFFEEAVKLSPLDHLKVLSGWQKFIDNCISKTINLKQTATEQDVLDVWMAAARENIKAVTIYRDQSKTSQPLSLGECRTGSCSV